VTEGKGEASHRKAREAGARPDCDNSTGRANHEPEGTGIMAELHSLPTNNQTLKVASHRRRSPAKPAETANRPALARQQQAAAAVAVVAVILTILSLSHLAHGVQLLTSCPLWESWAMAAGLDLAFLGCEIGLLASATDRVRKEIAGYCRMAIGGTMLVSAGLNGLAFGAVATGWFLYPAIGLGVSVPGLIYLLSRVSFTLASR
jgi:hypothetical protein